MKKKALGKSGIEVAPLAFGGNVFGWTVDEARGFELLDVFADAGFNLIDTADIYSKWAPGNSGGESETLIGKWLKRSGKRDRVVIATKVGMEMPAGKGLSRKYIHEAAEASLRRLQIDRIDLYQSHSEDPQTPIEETLSAYDELIKAGKVRAIGASNYDAESLRKALDAAKSSNLPRYETLQPPYNLYARSEFEEKLAPICRDEGIGVINYYPLAAGFLSGKYRSEADFGQSARGPGMKKYLNERGLRILDALDAAAKQHELKPAQVAIAWLLSKPAVTAPIASATTPAQLRELLSAADIALDSRTLESLDSASR